MTYSASLHGEHATTIAGNGKDPGIKDLLKVADAVGISQNWAREIVIEIMEKTISLNTKDNT